MLLARPFRVVATIATFAAVAFGLGTYTHANFTDIHMLLGLIVALALLILALLATLTSGMRRLGALGIAYAFLVPVFGVTQQMILAGNLHWLVETLHLGVGFGALAFINAISARLIRRRRMAGNGGPSSAEVVREAQSIG